MKRKEETAAIITELQLVGVQITPQILTAVERGLRRIRKQKYEERCKQKMARKMKCAAIESGLKTAPTA